MNRLSTLSNPTAMNKHCIFILALIFLQTLCSAQTQITFHFNNVQADSVFIKTATSDTAISTIWSVPFKEELTFKSKTSLEPGIYWVFSDKSILDAFLISSAKDQNFTANIDTTASYTGSIENARYHQYIYETMNFEKRLAKLDEEYQEAQQRMPQYMLRVLADTLTVKAQKIKAEKVAYQRQQIQENPGTLMASIIAANIEMPNPPQELYNNRPELMKYVVHHFFDDFPWNDPRIFKTPIGFNKIKEYAQVIFNCNNPELDSDVLETISRSKVNEESYYAFFDGLEKHIGYHGSPSRVERLYIAMLKDMLQYPKLTDLRKRHCRYELGVIDKNHAGDIAPDFKIVTDKGDTTTLHKIQSEYMLLYLQHPTCPTCQNVRHMIANFPILNSAIASGRLKVLTVYFEDEAEIWNNYLHSSEANPSYMHGWNFDQTISDDNLYDTRAIPYMFLLDKDKRIIVKNLNENKLEDEIKKLNILN